VGRAVREEPLKALRDALIIRVSAIVLLLVVIIALVSTWVASRMERLGKRVFEGVRKVVEEGEPVKFQWKGSAELRQLGENLSKLSETHARNLAELQDHARALEESNRYKSEFLANVSHELRTPLNSILLLSKLLLKESDGLSREQQEQLRVIHEASTDLRMLIDNVLDLSRMEAGRLEPVIEEVELLPLLEEIHDQLAPQFRDKGLKFRVRIAEEAPHRIRTDAHKLAQILKNFLSNSLKFTDRGEVVVALEAAASPYAVSLSVQDTGIGIPKEKQQAIFEAFQQADGSTRRRFGGTGLGLSISRELAEMLCGEIRVESSPGEGARFSLLLPANCGEPPTETTEESGRALPAAAVESSSAHPAQPDPSADLGGAHVLLVESDIGRLLQLSRLLEEWHLQVTAAEDEAEVREVLEEDGVQLLLLAEGVVDWCAVSAIVEKGEGRRPPLLGLGEATPEAAACVDAVLARLPDAQSLLTALRAHLPREESEES
jgi:signal transduction histidine kinase/CheY-like chemotaxis protein